MKNKVTYNEDDLKNILITLILNKKMIETSKENYLKMKISTTEGVQILWVGGWGFQIFYFVGANTFSPKFRLKQRESDTTEDVQNTGNLGISSSDKKFLTVA